MTKALVLRTCNSDLTSYGDFQWPSSGKVIAPDWDPKPICGKGLHGALYGEGNGALFNWGSDAKWLVVEVELESVVDLGGKVKFPECEVVYCGDRLGACKYLQENGCDGRAIIGGYKISGEKGLSITGYFGTSTSGYRGKSLSGYRGKSISEHHGISISGDWGTSISGYKGTCQSGEDGTIISEWFDENRERIVVGYVGEDGIEANIPYRLDSKGKWEIR